MHYAALRPAMASLAVAPEWQGDAMALTGTFRAAALLAVPAAVGALLSVVTLPVAVVALGLGLGLPGLAIGRGGGGADRIPAGDEAGTVS